MKKIIVLTGILFIGLVSFQKASTPFPKMSCNKLSGGAFTVPDSIKNNKYSVIGIAFSKKAEQNLATWFTPSYQSFIQKKKTLFADEVYDVNTYFIAVITGANKALADEATKQLKANTPVELQPYILTYVGEFASYKKTLNISNPDDPYFFVLDKTGNIVHQTSGAYSEGKMNGIKNAIDGE
jgi:hypothetical protein